MKWSVGESASLSRVIDDKVIHLFAEAVGDTNPVHLDEDAAAHSIFGRRIAHGMITASLVSAVLGTQLPGPGSIYMNQSLRFVAPVYIGEEITATVTITAIRSDKPILTLDTTVTKTGGQVVMEGEATILYKGQ